MDALRTELAAAEADVRRANARLEDVRRRIVEAGGISSGGKGIIYWDVTDNSFAAMVGGALEAAFPSERPVRWRKDSPRLGDRDVLFGFVILLGRLDTRDEDATAAWAATDRSVVVVARGPGVGKGHQDWVRPPDFAGIRQQMIHLYASLGGRRVIFEADFHVDATMFGLVNLWDRDSLPRLAEFMKRNA